MPAMELSDGQRKILLDTVRQAIRAALAGATRPAARGLRGQRLKGEAVLSRAFLTVALLADGIHHEVTPDKKPTQTTIRGLMIQCHDEAYRLR